jgi:Glycosyltransferases involved in cell wall biogenesis
MKSLKVTVVVPTYQRPDLLLRCLQALLFQDFPKDEYEILIVSDGLDPSTNHLLEDEGRQSTADSIVCTSF